MAGLRHIEGVTTHRQTVQALIGLLLALFVSTLSATVVSTALPSMIGSMQGSQIAATWVITATLLTTTVSVPVWGKLADLFSKKALVQIATAVFIVGSIVAGISQNIPELIVGRAIQGIGVGGIQALVQIAIGAMIAPRERGKYAGYQSSATAIATIGGPLMGGLIVDSSWLGWRWCFFLSVPIAIAALITVQLTLKLPVVARSQVKIDVLGATLISAGVSVVLIWISFVDRSFGWASWQTAAMVGSGVALLALAVFVETRSVDPILPLHILKERAVILSIIGSLAAGTAMFGASVFLSQYFQLARGFTPTAAGLLTIPMMVGILLSSLFGGRLLSRVGRLKPFLLVGTTSLTAGFACLGLIGDQTPIVLVCLPMLLVGAGIGLTAQNFVLLVQNAVSLRDIGTATSTVSFFRSLGGTIGVAVLGAVLARQVSHIAGEGLASSGLDPIGDSGPAASLHDPSFPSAAKEIVRAAFGDATGHIFLISAAVAVVGILAALALPAVRLRETLDLPEQLDIAIGGPGPDVKNQAKPAVDPCEREGSAR